MGLPEWGESSNKSSMLRTLLRNVYPMKKLSLEPGRRADIYRWPWIRTSLMRLFFQLDVGPSLCLMVAACRAQPLSCLDLP